MYSVCFFYSKIENGGHTMTGSRLGVLWDSELYLTIPRHTYIWSMSFVFRSCFHLGNMTKNTQRHTRSSGYRCVRQSSIVVAYGIHIAFLENLAILLADLKVYCFKEVIPASSRVVGQWFRDKRGVKNRPARPANWQLLTADWLFLLPSC